MVVNLKVSPFPKGKKPIHWTWEVNRAFPSKGQEWRNSVAEVAPNMHPERMLGGGGVTQWWHCSSTVYFCPHGILLVAHGVLPLPLVQRVQGSFWPDGPFDGCGFLVSSPFSQPLISFEE